MVRPSLVSALFAAVMVVVASLAGASAQTITPEETAKLGSIREVVGKIEKERDSQSESFNGLLALRDRLDPVREDLREIVTALQDRLTAAQAQLAEFGAKPGAGEAAEAQQKTSERDAKQALVNEIDGHFRSARALQVHIDQLWDSMNDLRRELFSRRIFQHQDSILSPGVWAKIFSDSLPDSYWRGYFKLIEIDSAITRKNGWPVLFGIAAFMLLVIGALAWFHIWLGRKRQQAAPDEAITPSSNGAVITHAIIVMAMRTAPLLAIAMVIFFAVTRFDIVPSEAQTFLIGLAGAILIFGIGDGSIRAAFSPHAPTYRIIRTDDRTAKRAVRVLEAMLIIYLCGLVVLGIGQMLSVHLTLTIATTSLTSALVITTGALMLLREPAVSSSDRRSGLMQAPVHLVRPVFWFLAFAILAALLLGFIAFAGFLVGRALATAIILCIAVLLYIAIDTIFLEGIAPGKPANQKIATMFGVQQSVVDLIGTIIAGTLRVMTVVFTVLILLSPWGIEFGNVNPFEDVFFGVRFGDIRGWIGAAGIAIVLFGFGLIATRLFVSWLDQQLLPRTALNTGVRHSITTIAGYIGFLIAITIALSQAGVQLQNIALVASALSVGIGFGLQQIVSNFVAGLIVLAERPIRVGDIIVVRGEEGKVRKINVRATELSLSENSTVIVPNADIVSSIVKNRSFNDPTHRTTLKFALNSNTDIKVAFDILLKAANSHPNVLKDQKPKAYIVKVAESGIEIEMNVICDLITNMKTVRSDIYFETLVAFRAAGINMAA